MLKTLFGKNGTGSKSGAFADSSSGKVDIERVKTLIAFFPIGKKLRYYPEFNKDIVLDTLIVAYCVNGHFVYSLEAVDMDTDGVPTAFRWGEGDTRLAASALNLFQILVPDTSDLERKLDYLRRAQISRNGQFSKGNYISLMSNAGIRGVSTVDTEVAKQIILHDGPYAHMNMVLLTPELHTLSVTDQRRKPRTRTNVPVGIILPTENFSGRSTIVDISDAELRIRLNENGPNMPTVRKGDAVIVDIQLGESERHYTVKGSVIRRSSETCVIHLDGQISDGRLLGFSPLDLLELKAGLLNYGK